MKIVMGIIFILIAAVTLLVAVSTQVTTSMHQIHQGIMFLSFICSLGFACLILKSNKVEIIKDEK